MLLVYFPFEIQISLRNNFKVELELRTTIKLMAPCATSAAHLRSIPLENVRRDDI